MQIRLNEGESFALHANELSMRIVFSHTDSEGNAHLKIKDIGQYRTIVAQDGNELVIIGTPDLSEALGVEIPIMPGIKLKLKI